VELQGQLAKVGSPPHFPAMSPAAPQAALQRRETGIVELQGQLAEADAVQEELRGALQAAGREKEQLAADMAVLQVGVGVLGGWAAQPGHVVT